MDIEKFKKSELIVKMLQKAKVPFLHDMLNVYIAEDLKNLENTSDVEIKAALRGISVEEYVSQQKELMAALTEICNERIKELQG